ncbi:hypothetical protein E2C01_085481 [Portunus trituberculatus]|uniref:Reverse transcriptase domain-containing protein n=1 Tax=Portunus trituberculatus TaxID=210409 RepID=A0A5B7J2U4_PORTR|nr:hypothetical protein [Portunus trituberculatus]
MEWVKIARQTTVENFLEVNKVEKDTRTEKALCSGPRTSWWGLFTVSSEEVFELGTPLDGVLSPMLFNVLMDKITRCYFPQGIQVLIYADNILLQCPTPRIL